MDLCSGPEFEETAKQAMNFRFPTVLTGLAMALAGCASTSPLSVNTRGAMPPPGTLEFPGGVAPTGTLGQDILAQLAARGFTRADHATYLAQITVARVPGKAGLFVPDSDPGAEARWLVAPSPSRSIGLRVATVTLSDRATGRELYRIIASERQSNGKPETDERITQAIAGKLDSVGIPSVAEPVSR